MNDEHPSRTPAALEALVTDTAALGFGMASEARVGALLAVLAASKPGGRMLELGTGTGHATAWLLAGMDASARLDTVDTDPAAVAVARRHLGADRRVTFHLVDGADFLRRANPGSFDLIFADAWPGKFSHLDDALAVLRAGGLYVVDDLVPQPNWPDGHDRNVPPLLDALERRRDLATVRLCWASGLMIVARRSSSSTAWCSA